MRKAAAKVQKNPLSNKKKDKIMSAEANFSLFTFHFSLFFVPLQLIRVSKIAI